MFQDNPLLAQLKQQLHTQTPRVEGIVKGTDKNFGFLEVDNAKTYFIPPQQMKKVMHGDKIVAAIRKDKEREIAEPETLITPFLTRFVGRIHKKDNKLFIIPDHPNLKDAIFCRPIKGLEHDFQEQDWVIAEMVKHPLQGSAFFNAEITEYITFANDHFAPWWVTLARNKLEKAAPETDNPIITDANINRSDLSELNFFTIDSDSTEDMDDAIFLEQPDDQHIKIHIAIADPTAYISEGSDLDLIAKKRAFTNYLPGFEIPMLPKALSHTLCSLQPNQQRPALVCSVSIDLQGALIEDAQFTCCWVTSKAKLSYDKVSDWLELENSSWQPEDPVIADQLKLFQRFAALRSQWRQQNALVFKEKPDYRFILNQQGEITEIKTELRRTANRMIEEAMITANICAANLLKNKVGFGIFNTHPGFDASKMEQLISVLKESDVNCSAEELATLSGFKQLRHLLDQQVSPYLDMRTRRYQSYAEMSLTAGPHFGLGLENYATWTSPIRKYSDIINHRLLKAYITNSELHKPDEALPQLLSERRKAHKVAEREISDWLYCRYLSQHATADKIYLAEISDVTRGSLRAKLLENGATIFIPAAHLHPVREEIVCQQEKGIIIINGEQRYRQGDQLEVVLTDIRLETRSIIAKPINS